MRNVPANGQEETTMMTERRRKTTTIAAGMTTLPATARTKRAFHKTTRSRTRPEKTIETFTIEWLFFKESNIKSSLLMFWLQLTRRLL